MDSNDSGFFSGEAAQIFYHICSPACHTHRLFPWGGSEQGITEGEKNAVVMQGEADPSPASTWSLPQLSQPLPSLSAQNQLSLPSCILQDS